MSARERTYDAAVTVAGMANLAVKVGDLDAELARHDVLWGPRVVSGAFGTRRIAFVSAPGGIRLEFMEQLEAPQ